MAGHSSRLSRQPAAAGRTPASWFTREGEIVVGHPGEPTLLFFDRKGRFLRRRETKGFLELHGLRLLEENGQQRLWISDNGTKFQVSGSEVKAVRAPDGGRVAQLDLEGQTVRALERPDIPAYVGSRFSPTSVAVDEERYGGRGDVWVADGYGASLVHRYDRRGRHTATLTGEEGAGRFDCPHGVIIDRRKGEPELYITDRANSRIQVSDLEGHFTRSFGTRS